MTDKSDTLKKQIDNESRMTRMEENIKRLPSIEEKLDKLVTKTNEMVNIGRNNEAKGKNHEDRIGSLEDWKIKVVAIATTVSFAGTYIIDWVLSKV